MSVVGRSLHDVDGDARVRIRTILFERVREACACQGVHAGQTVRVRRGGDALLLELPAGRAVPLRREWARFIEVEPRGAARPPLRHRAPAHPDTGSRP